MVRNILNNYSETIYERYIKSSATTRNYDPTNKTPLNVFMDLAIVDDCFFHVDAYDGLIFDLNANMPKLDIRLDETICNRIRKVPDFTKIINYFTFKGGNYSYIFTDKFWIIILLNSFSIFSISSLVKFAG